MQTSLFLVVTVGSFGSFVFSVVAPSLSLLSQASRSVCLLRLVLLLVWVKIPMFDVLIYL